MTVLAKMIRDWGVGISLVGWLTLFAYTGPARGEIFVSNLDTSIPTFYDLNQLKLSGSPQEWEANRYGRRIRSTPLQFKFYLDDAGRADTNVHYEIVYCICPGGSCTNGVIPSLGNPVYAEGDPCHTDSIDYSQYLFFDYNDPHPSAESFNKSAVSLRSANPTADPVLGTLLTLRLEPAPISWAIRYPPGMALPGTQQFNPASCPVGEFQCSLYFRNVLIYKMGIDSPNQLVVFVPSILHPKYTDPAPTIAGALTRYSSFMIGDQEFDSPEGISTAVYFPGTNPEPNTPYSSPLCMDILSSLSPTTWQTQTGIRLSPLFDIDPSRTLEPKHPMIASFVIAQLNLQQMPPTDLQHDFHYQIDSSPLWRHPGPLDKGESDVLFPIGTVTLTEDRIGYLGPPSDPFTVKDPPGALAVNTVLAIQPALSEVTFAADLMSPEANGFIRLQPPLAGFSKQSKSDTFVFQSSRISAEIRVRDPLQAGEIGFQSGLIRVPRSKVRQLTEADPSKGENCLYFEISVTHFSSDCMAIDREVKTVPLVCVNPNELDSSTLNSQ